MRSALVILVLFSSGFVHSQLWRDSLDAARKAYKDEKYLDALKYYKSAQNNAPENIDFSDEIGQTAYKARQFDVAEKIYRQNAGNKLSKQEKANNWHNAGNALMKKQNYADAVEAYKQSLRMNPTDEETRYNLSEAIRKMKQAEKKQQQKQDQNKQNSDQQQQNQGQQESQGKQGDQQQKGDQQKGNQGQNNNYDSQGSENGSQGQLGDQSVEKLLDKLTKEEAETKRRLAPGGNKSKGSKSGKDW
ncbi:MAG: tetratricopeptide repeat protein [Crocinitomicaceae bacterium]